MITISRLVLAAIFFIFSVSDSLSQMSAEVYKRADDLAKVTAEKVYYGDVRPVWIGKSNRFLYENLTPEGTEFMIFDSEKLTKRKAFNQEKFAESLGKQTGKEFEPGKLPIRNLVFSDKLSGFSFMTYMLSVIFWRGDFAKTRILISFSDSSLTGAVFPPAA